MGFSSDNNLAFSALAMPFRFALFFDTSRVPAQSMLVSPTGEKHFPIPLMSLSCLPLAGQSGSGLLSATRQKAGRCQA